MAVDGQASLVSALEARRFADVIGTPESEWVDFKQAAYAFDGNNPRRLSQRGRWELCKDVAAFANARGGSIVLGYKETASPTRGVMVAGDVSPIPIERVDVGHYRDVLHHGIYPPVDDVEIIWYPEREGAKKGVLLINVRSSDEKPHVLRKLVTESGEEIEAVGVPVRVGDRTVWYTAERIHHLLRQAERGLSRHPAAEGVTAEGVWVRADEHRDRVVELLEWQDKAIYVLHAVPIGGPTSLPGFYDDVKDALERPPSIRPNGFNMRSLGGFADVISGALVVRRMGDAAAWLDRDGLLTVAVLASPDFLGWAINRDHSQEVMLINSTVLVELTLEFCRFVHLILKPLAESARWEYRGECLRFMHPVQIALMPGAPPALFPRDAAPASDDHWSYEVSDRDAPEELAFELLSQVYALFGLSEKDIPYTTDRRVDTEQILVV